MNRMFSQYEIYAIIGEEIKRQMELKNSYIQKNGYKHTDILQRFDCAISTLSGLYSKFNGEVIPYDSSLGPSFSIRGPR